MPKAPKIPKPVPSPMMPTSASYVSSASRGSGALSLAMGNRRISPVIGSSSSSVGRPSLLGGM